MLSRVADSLYWMSRYVERAENVARFIEVNLNLLIDSPIELKEQWLPIVKTSGDIELFEKKYDTLTKENVIDFLTFNLDNPNSIISCLKSARENSRSVREIISSETWIQINSFYNFLNNEESRNLALDDPSDYYTRVINCSHSFIGVTNSTMSHNEGWQFCMLGRFIERADKTSRILDVKYFLLLPSVYDVGTPIDFISWSALLRSASGYEMYRKKFRRITPTNVAKFLILDPEFPRSILYCVNVALESIKSITGTSNTTYSNKTEMFLGRLSSELIYANIEEIIEDGLHEFLDNFQLNLNNVGETIYKTYFTVQPISEINFTRSE